MATNWSSFAGGLVQLEGCEMTVHLPVQNPAYHPLPLPLRSCDPFVHRAQSGLIRRDREIRIFGYFSFFMHARIISERDFQTIHLESVELQAGR